MKTKVLVFPKDANPYQQLLYGNMSDHVKIAYFQNLRKPRIINMILTPIELAYFRLRGYKILHLHWVFSFHFSNNNYFLMWLSEQYFNMFILCLRLLGYKLIWTVHDLFPHERTFVNDVFISKKLASISNALIVLNTDSKNTLENDFAVSLAKIALIPMGNFIDYYTHDIKNKHREDKINFLFFGQIKSYKGIHSLIESFSLLPDSSIRLSIVGPSNESSYLNRIRQLIENDKRISLRNTFIPDNLVGEVFSEADVVVLPFSKVTNTSSALLAFSMKKSIIAPRIGMIKDFPENTGFYYDPKDKNGLLNSLVDTIKSKKKLSQMGEKSFKYAQSLDWKNISKNTFELYERMQIS